MAPFPFYKNMLQFSGWCCSCKNGALLAKFQPGVLNPFVLICMCLLYCSRFLRHSVFPWCKDSPQIVVLWWKWLGWKIDRAASKPLTRHLNLPNHSHHNMTICSLSSHHKTQKAAIRTKIHLSTGYTLSMRVQWTPLIPLIYSQVNVIHISTNGKASPHPYINQKCPTISLFVLTKV